MRVNILLCILFFLSFRSLEAQNFVWAKKVSSVGIDEPQSMVLDKSGNVYTIGYFQDTCDFDPGPGSFTLAPSSSLDTFILKLDSTGNFVWAIKIGGVGYISAWHQAASITIDTLNNIYATGFFGGIVDMDPGPGTYTLSQTGLHDVFVTKYTSGGSLVWAKQFGSSGFEQSCSICLDPNGNVITTGSFEFTVDFDPGPGYFSLTASGNNNCFISKLDNNGNFLWAKSFSGSLTEGHGIVSNQQGDLYCTGTFCGVADFDPSSSSYPLSSGSNSTAEVFVAKLNSSGGFVWAKNFGGLNSPDDGTTIALDKSGNIYLGGVFTGTSDFDPGPGTFTAASFAGFEDVYLLKLDNQGNFLWVKQFGGSDYECLYALKIDTASNIYLAGGFISANVDFDPGPTAFTMTPNGGFVPGQGDIFVLKLSSAGNFSWAVQMGGKGPDGAYAMALDETGNVYNAGAFSADQFSDFDPGQGQYIMQSHLVWPQDGFITRLSKNCYKPAQPVSNPPLNFCLGTTATLSASSPGGISWYSTLTSTIPLSNASSMVISTSLTGTQTYFAEARGCINNPNRTQITITVNALPNVLVSFSPSPFCQGDFPIIIASGAQTFSWQGGLQTNSMQIGPPYLSSYVVIGMDSLGCRKQVSIAPIIEACVGVDEINQSRKILFPNPANEYLYLTIGDGINSVNHLILYDQFGRKVKELELIFNNGKSSFKTDDLSNGIYFIRLEDSIDKSNELKIIIDR